MSKVRTECFKSFDGTELALHRLDPESGEGRPVILLHGLFSSADMNWIRFGHAEALADAGFAVVMPDLRAHGESEAPHEPERYPQGVLVRDVEAVAASLGAEEFDLVGFSLGARTAVGAVLAGLAPRRLVLAGMGLEGLTGWEKRAAFFHDAIDRFDSVKRGDSAFVAVQFMKTMEVDREAAALLLDSVDDIEPGDLARLTVPTLVLTGDQDRDNGSPEALVEALPDARRETVAGTHMSSVTDKALGYKIAAFLQE